MVPKLSPLNCGCHGLALPTSLDLDLWTVQRLADTRDRLHLIVLVNIYPHPRRPVVHRHSAALRPHDQKQGRTQLIIMFVSDVHRLLLSCRGYHGADQYCCLQSTDSGNNMHHGAITVCVACPCANASSRVLMMTSQLGDDKLKAASASSADFADARPAWLRDPHLWDQKNLVAEGRDELLRVVRVLTDQLRPFCWLACPGICQ